MHLAFLPFASWFPLRCSTAVAFAVRARRATEVCRGCCLHRIKGACLGRCLDTHDVETIEWHGYLRLSTNKVRQLEEPSGKVCACANCSQRSHCPRLRAEASSSGANIEEYSTVRIATVTRSTPWNFLAQHELCPLCMCLGCATVPLGRSNI